ncbi:MAG: hypothetical protein GX022_01590 [Clostridiaceae bacterium]|nr:hypothetical protein [Clostridiaceae bacterium]
MDYIRKLPLLMALSSGIITGLAGYASQVANKENMTNMFIVMIIFYIVGLLIRGTLIDIIETNRKKEEERIREEKRLAREKEREERERQRKEKKAAGNVSGNILNLAADEDLKQVINDEEFEDLPIADYIRSELKK